MVETPKDFVVIRIEKEHKESISYGSLNLQIDSGYDPEGNRICFGKVESYPRAISSGMKATSRIKEGTEIFFHYLAMHESNIFTVNFERFARIHIPFIIATKPDDKWIPFDGWSFCEKIYDEDVTTLEDGMKVKISPSGIISEVNVGHNLLEATIRSVGTPLENEPDLDLNKGDTILFDQHCDFDNVGNTLDGKEYLYIRQSDIMLKKI
jgi:co-chaperonin GroES (HSP10)